MSKTMNEPVQTGCACPNCKMLTVLELECTLDNLDPVYFICRFCDSRIRWTAGQAEIIIPAGQKLHVTVNVNWPEPRPRAPRKPKVPAATIQ
jgi:hypothetical protein